MSAGGNGEGSAVDTGPTTPGGSKALRRKSCSSVVSQRTCAALYSDGSWIRNGAANGPVVLVYVFHTNLLIFLYHLGRVHLQDAGVLAAAGRAMTAGVASPGGFCKCKKMFLVLPV